MTEPLSPECFAEIRERCVNATPGPWGVGNETTIALDVEQTSSGSFTCTVRIAEVADDIQREQDADEHQLGEIAPAEDDALFIAHARTDVEDLLNEIKRLQQRVGELETGMRDIGGMGWA